MEEEGSLPVAAWLSALHLDQYVESFQQSELWSVWDCRALTDEGLTRLGVLLPGHRRRILLGLQKAFAEAPLPAGAQQPPATKPVPMKRHIFRPSAAAGPEQPEPRGLPGPAKRHQLETKCQNLKGPPLPDRPPVLPPRAQRSIPAKEEVPITERAPGVTVSSLLPLPRTQVPPTPPALPSKATLPFVPEFDDSDYEDSAWESEIARPTGEMAKEDAEPGMGRPRSVRFNSLFSEDEFGEDQPSASPASGGSSWSDRDPSLHPPAPDAFAGSSPGTLSDSMEGTSATSLLSPTIKAGWLDKNPPQGSYIYQKRWVKLDTDYLRYFDSEKDTYSKRLIPVSSISRVSSVGDQKFEVVTNNRNFVFRAENDADRNEWIWTLQQIAEEQKSKAAARTSMSLASDSATELADKSGFLELRGFKHKLFVVVAGDKVFLYKNAEDYRLGIGITYIEMNVGNVKEVDRRGFDLTTPYRIFSFSADSEQEKEEWVEAMQQSIIEALSNSEVAERIWAVESNRFCADCGSPKPDWASINLCVVICKRCAAKPPHMPQQYGHVGISLSLFSQLFQQFGNVMANQFWAANVPPSEAISPTSGSQERRRFLIAKYREGKYRHYHPLFGNQEELDRALCAAVTTSDLAETQALLFCGASVTCDTGDPQCPTPLALAERSGQRLQMEFLLHNKTSEPPRLEVMCSEEKPYSVHLPSITHNGFLYKTPSMVKPISERKGPEEFSRRWCTLQDGVLSYYENDRNTVPNGEIRVEEIVCLVNNPLHAHGIESTFEVYTEADRLYLFGLESPDSAREWLKSIAKSFVHPCAEELLALDFERLGRLHYKGGLTLERAQEGWFALVGSTLHICSEDGRQQEPLQLRKLQELSIQGDHEVLVLVERRRTLYIQGERKLDFLGWVHAIQKAASSSGDTLSEQQLTDSDVPLLVDRCIDYITQCGLTSEGIYRKSGQNSKTTSLLEVLQRDARCVCLKEGEHQVDDVANTLKRFFRDLGDGLFTRRWAPDWLWATALEDEEAKVGEYRQLLAALPPVNRATLKALINHLFRYGIDPLGMNLSTVGSLLALGCGKSLFLLLMFPARKGDEFGVKLCLMPSIIVSHRVQCFSAENQMNTHNLAIVFGPTLFQTDGKDYKAGRVVEDLISHYVEIFNVNDQEMKKQQDEITAIMKMREASSSGTQQAGDFICTVYLEEKKTETEQHVKIPATMTAEELTFEILDRRKIVMKEKDYWSCFEVNEKEEAERPLHYSEKVLPILHCLGTESYLVVKKQMSMENMLIYLASRVGDCKHGLMKFREERNLLGLGLSTGFHDRYFILNHSWLRLYKEVRSLRQRSPPLESVNPIPATVGTVVSGDRSGSHQPSVGSLFPQSHKPEKEWPVRNLKVYLGVKKKLRPPTCWGFTVFYENEKHEKQQWYLCCDTQADLREWFATFLQVQNGGALWPSERPKMRVARPQQDARLGNISLIPLRGNESEMRNSVAAFATDPLTLLRNV
ncbi:Arf-GAP with Rho-GAP domain, ANK repeat and PH domain-containing protein 1 [Lonchura striata]|uniref:Arf-GAP with Rho-GAP domain, ANK repeat and PH domain-containing protein 1 n=1 Tax=Lonchura striata TaxID=40157 RepID=A0A218VAD4_9PASE|nr:Arf-GAP with Rho-GAP domain, ANK repeat and PH domain-containing protein 1 [Lonchura striata domestica]